MPIRIMLVDDHQVVRDGLRALLERHNFTVVAEASDGRDAVKQAERLKPDVAIVDLGMPRLNGLDAATQIVRESPTTRIIALTMHDEAGYVISALRAGVKGYVLKSQAGTDLVHAIAEVHRGVTYLSPGISGSVVYACLGRTEVASDRLTLREREVLQLVAEGKTTKEVAQTLGIGVKTADAHRSSVMRKLDIHETASLVRAAIRLGLVEP